MRRKIAQKTIEGLLPGARSEIVWDTELRGFGCRVTPTGIKTYLLKYRAGRRQRWLRIGPHGPLTADAARNAARRALVSIARGEDPVGERQGRRVAPLVRDLAMRYLTDHAAPKNKPSSVRGAEMLLAKHILPAIGRMHVIDVSRRDMLTLHNRMRNTPYQANRTLALCSKMFNLAETWEMRPQRSNPCYQVERFPEKPRSRYMSRAELAMVGEALDDAEKTNSVRPVAVAAIRMLLLTGARLGEILGLRWRDIDWESRCIRLEDSKTGSKLIALPEPACDLLRTLPKVDDNPHVFPGDAPGNHLKGLQAPWRRIRQMVGLTDLRLHDLRRTFTTTGVTSGLGLRVMSAVMGHRTIQTTAKHYAMVPDESVHAASETIAREILASMTCERQHLERPVPALRKEDR